MDSYKFQEKCKEWLRKYYKTQFEIELRDLDIYVVWSCKTLQNNKILMSTNISDGIYVECTHNGDKKETYFDIYKEKENVLVSNSELGLE